MIFLSNLLSDLPSSPPHYTHNSAVPFSVFPASAVTLSGLHLLVLCVLPESLWVHMLLTLMSSEDPVSLKYSIISGYYNLSTSSSAYIPESSGEVFA